MLSSIRSTVYRIQDSFRIRTRLLLARFFRKSTIKLSEEKSDSQNTPYEKSLLQIVNSEKKLKRFRRNLDYRLIVETVSFQIGLEYLNQIKSLGTFDEEQRTLAKINDSFGKPRKFKYDKNGKISPTTLRYISVALEIKKLFPDLNNARIAEVGVGYGGQASILMSHLNAMRYDLFDLPAALTLSKYFLSKIGKSEGVKFSSLETLEDTEWDLVISNYAFSELPKDLQLQYIKKVFQKSKRGYLIMNSGLTDITGRNSGKLSMHEIQELISGTEIKSEVPKTGPDNYLIVWGHEINLKLK